MNLWSAKAESTAAVNLAGQYGLSKFVQKILSPDSPISSKIQIIYDSTDISHRTFFSCENEILIIFFFKSNLYFYSLNFATAF
jgi:hypothetical protein